MIKKFIPIIILCVAFALSVCASATDTSDEQSTDSSVPQENTIPQERGPGGGRMGGGRGGMGGTPADAVVQNGEDVQIQDSEASQTQPFPGNPPEGRGGNMGGQMPGNLQPTGEPSASSDTGNISNFLKTYSTPVTSVVLLALAYVFVIFYKRRRY